MSAAPLTSYRKYWAARFGVAIEGCTLYTTLQPCFGCLKELLQASVREGISNRHRS